jgi:hypothetical protein
MKASRKINKKNRKELLMFCLLVWLSVSPCFAQSQGTPTGQQPQQAPPPTTNSTPSSTSVDGGGALKGSIYPNKFPGSTPALPKGGRAQDVDSRQQSAEAATEPPGQLTDKQPANQPSEAHATFTYGADIDFNSAYVWRGLLLSNGPVGQPSAWISAYGFTFTAWSSVALTSTSVGALPQMGGAGPQMGGALPQMGGAGLQMGGAGPQMGGSRLQTGSLGLTYDRDWEKLRMEATLDAYLGQQSSDIETRNTMESSLMLSYPVGPLRIFTTHAFDVLAYRGSYFGEAGLKYERQFKKSTEFSISTRSGWASAKFNDVYIGVNKSAFNYVGVEGSLTFNLGQRLYFQPHIEFSSITGRTLRAQLSQSNIVNFGIAFGFSK